MEYHFTRTCADEPETNQQNVIDRADLIEIFPFLRSAPNFDDLILVIDLTKYQVTKIQ